MALVPLCCLVFALAAIIANAGEGVCEAGDATCKASKKIVNYYPNKDYIKRHGFGLDTTINQVNLAMSHDSGCRWDKYKGSGRRLTKKTEEEIISHGAVTQDLSLADQFKVGVRVFDIRSNEDGVMYHAFGVGKKYKFANIKEEIFAFAVRVCLSEDFALFKFKGTFKAMKKVEDAIRNFAVGYKDDEAAQKVIEEFKKSKENVEEVIKGCAEKQMLFPAEEFDASKTTIGALQQKIVVMNDKGEEGGESQWKKSMKVDKIEINALLKWLGGVPDKVAEKALAKCKKGRYLRLGFTHTGFPSLFRLFKKLRSPLCMAYRNDDAIQKKINQVLGKAEDNSCHIIFSTDGTGDILNKKHDTVNEYCPHS